MALNQLLIFFRAVNVGLSVEHPFPNFRRGFQFCSTRKLLHMHPHWSRSNRRLTPRLLTSGTILNVVLIGIIALVQVSLHCLSFPRSDPCWIHKTWRKHMLDTWHIGQCVLMDELLTARRPVTQAGPCIRSNQLDFDEEVMHSKSSQSTQFYKIFTDLPQQKGKKGKNPVT